MRSAVGVDIGGTAIKIAVVTEKGSVTHRTSIETRAQDQPEATMGRLAEAARPILEKARQVSDESDELVPVGIGCAGLVSSETGVVHLSPNLPTWKVVPLGRTIGGELRAPVCVLNDANAFVLGEGRVGAGRDARNLLGLTLGTGVGGGILVDGKLYTGMHGFAAELGHTSVDMEGPPCPCGGRGCLESYVGSKAIVQRYLELTDGMLGTRVSELVGGDTSRVTPLDLFEGAREGDSEARETFRITGEILGVGLANLTNSFNPDLIVVGGGVSQAGDLILEPARRVMRERAMYPAEYCPELRLATLGPEAGVIGAAIEALDRA